VTYDIVLQLSCPLIDKKSAWKHTPKK